MAFGSMNSGDDAPMSDINVTPLVDVMLVLLIVFMITMPVLTHSIPLELPTASEKAAKEDKQSKDPLRLSIDASGAYVVGGDSDTKVDLATVTAKLKEAKAKNEDVIVAIAADKAVEYDYVNQALQAAREAGISKIGFVTETKAQ
ncbi:biopolymer transporter ExbD [Neisseria flavescens]|uniref:Transport energizing protein, ExbD/TolR family n=1 Tax=Neisseria flavescens NRL30031/H210 TaxID=546264 RepID=C0EM59_NEIFL|nr:biopolymer transporter ExbD [Neisseria flavescens]SPY03977.1 ExbD protein [Neisseria meningitidis]EEG33922.1 transport energizing protein, ExbD/TolR family [Neisseria flavescens NRL30031/H210]QCL68036.1 biopolymer transporter ExbD [Neisseria flavescens]SPY06591.1 ExbD protein [Neisseria meningitidis]STZ64441.1 ExbD protein [Neisseria flavescens]